MACHISGGFGNQQCCTSCLPHYLGDEADPEVTSRLTQEEIDEIFNPTYYTKRVDEIFERIGLGD